MEARRNLIANPPSADHSSMHHVLDNKRPSHGSRERQRAVCGIERPGEPGGGRPLAGAALFPSRLRVVRCGDSEAPALAAQHLVPNVTSSPRIGRPTKTRSRERQRAVAGLNARESREAGDHWQAPLCSLRGSGVVRCGDSEAPALAAQHLVPIVTSSPESAAQMKTRR